jgi:HlyD family type I secretion membrane fusion protein
VSIDATVGTSNAASQNLSELISTKGVIKSGYIVITVFILIFGIWGSTLPLTQAAVVPGVVGVDGQKKIIQHLDGGIVAEIHVRNGDIVIRNQPLITLNRVDMQSRFKELLYQRFQLGAELARWRAELEGAARIEFPKWLLKQSATVEAAEAMQTQIEIRKARQAVLVSSVESLEVQSKLADQEAISAQRRLKNKQSKQTLIGQELIEQRRYERSGLVTRSKVFELEKEATDLVLEIDEAKAEIVGSTRQTEQVASELRQLLHTRIQEAAESSTSVANELSRITQLISTASTELARTRVLSPVDGYVVNSKLNTVGGVVTAGQPFMEIVPRGKQLLIESRVDAKDRDTVRVGQSAQIRFTALNRRATPPLNGVVKLIAADRTVDQSTKQVYYSTTIELLEDPAIALEGSKIYPGMLAEVIIKTGEQTLLRYLLSPILRSFDRALREE